MARRPIEPGRWGRISRKEISPGVWRAQAQYRDFAGVLHKDESRGPSGAAAQRALEDKLHRASTEATVNKTSTITPATRMGIVFDHWVAEKRAEGLITMQSLETYRASSSETCCRLSVLCESVRSHPSQ